jgi:hypothetical protein
MLAELEELNKRLIKLEKQKDQEIVALIEILSNATFFGDLKKVNCLHAKDGQCSFFILKTGAKNKIPIVATCKIENCQVPTKHCHIELSNITCTFCQATKMDPSVSFNDPNQLKPDIQNLEASSDKGPRTTKTRSKLYVQ